MRVPEGSTGKGLTQSDACQGEKAERPLYCQSEASVAAQPPGADDLSVLFINTNLYDCSGGYLLPFRIAGSNNTDF